MQVHKRLSAYGKGRVNTLDLNNSFIILNFKVSKKVLTFLQKSFINFNRFLLKFMIMWKAFKLPKGFCLNKLVLTVFQLT
jgi:hypothetical protein